jgi:hypothetical protein
MGHFYTSFPSVKYLSFSLFASQEHLNPIVEMHGRELKTRKKRTHQQKSSDPFSNQPPSDPV